MCDWEHESKGMYLELYLEHSSTQEIDDNHIILKYLLYCSMMFDTHINGKYFHIDDSRSSVKLAAAFLDFFIHRSISFMSLEARCISCSFN